MLYKNKIKNHLHTHVLKDYSLRTFYEGCVFEEVIF